MRLLDGRRTKRVPQDQGKLRNLLALLAQLQKGLFAGALVQQIGNVGHGAAVVLGHVGIVGGRILVDGVEGVRMASGGGDTVEVSLLGSGGCSGSLLGMLMMRLLVHPGRGFLRIVMLAAVHGMVGHHLDVVGGGPQRRASGCMNRRLFQVSGWSRCSGNEQRKRLRWVEGGVVCRSRSAEGCFGTFAGGNRRGSCGVGARRAE